MSDHELRTLASGLALELRNALFGIAATLDSFEHRFGDDLEQARYVAVLREWVERMVVLSQQLVDYGGAMRGTHLVPTSLVDVVRAATRASLAIAEPLGVSLDVDHEPGIPPLVLDRTRIVLAVQLFALLHHPDSQKRARVLQAMLAMNKLDIAALEGA